VDTQHWNVATAPQQPRHVSRETNPHQLHGVTPERVLADSELIPAGRRPKPLGPVVVNLLSFCATCRTLAGRMDRTTPDQKQKRERFRELAQTGKVKIGKVFAADLRKSKVPSIVRKLTAWRKANRLSQRKAVSVLGQYYFHVTFASLRSWEEGRRSPNPHTARILEKFLTDHPTVEFRKKK
jgi:DNA-binding transcriptional regulator YiaG